MKTDPVLASEARWHRKPWGSLTLRVALAVLLLGSVWLFLSYLARCDRDGRRTLFQLSLPMAGLISAGRFLSRVAEAHVAGIRGAVLALALVGCGYVIWRRRGELGRALPAALGLSFLALSASFFLPPPLRLLGFLVSLAGGVTFLFLDGLPGGEAPTETMPGPQATGLLLLIVGSAAALRFFALAEVPRGFSEHPVVQHNDLTFRFLEEIFPMLTSGQWGSAARWVGHSLVNDRLGLTCLLGAVGFKLIGVSFVTARLVSATAGCLTVLAAYFLGAKLWNRRLGLLFGYLLAVSPWHVTISRYGALEHVLSPLQLLLALGFYAAALRGGRLRDYLLAAAFLGLSWFVYPSNMIVPIVVGLHLTLLLLFRRGFLRREGWRICAFALLFGLFSYAPCSKMLREGLLKPGARTGYQGSSEIALRDTDRNRKMLAAEGKELFVQVWDPWFSKPGGGLSLTETALFLPGIVLCAGGLFVPSLRLGSSLLLIALPFSILPGVFAPDVSFRRILLTATIALLLASLVLSRSLDALGRLGLRGRARLFGLALLTAAIGAVNAHIYFERVRVDSEEGTQYMTQMSKSVRASLGREFLYVYVAPGTPTVDYHRYIRLAAYEQLQELGRRGMKREDLYEIVPGRDVLEILKAPRRIEGRFRILAEDAILLREAKEFDLRRAVRDAFPQAEEQRLPHTGKQVLTSWRFP